MLKYSVGIDISHRDFHVCISTIDSEQAVKVRGTTSFPNTASGFRALDGWVRRHHTDKALPLVAVMEATGVYYEACALYLHTAGYHVSVVLPNKSKKYIQALGIRTKNDKSDARALSRMAAEQSLERWQPMSTYFFTLRAYTRQLQSMQETRTALSNQLHAARLTMYRVGLVEEQLAGLVKTIDGDIARLQAAIDDHIKSDPTVAAKAEKMRTVKGVGATTVAVLLAETNGFALFANTGQLVSYAGYDIVENQSGMRAGRTGISKKGNHRIRRILHMPSLNAVAYDVKPFADLYSRVHERTRIKMKGYVAVQKKLLVVLYTLWKKDEAFKTNGGTEQVPSSRLAQHEP